MKFWTRKLKTLDTRGFSHHLLLPILVVAVIGAIGARIVFSTHAQTPVHYTINLGQTTDGSTATRATTANLTGCWFAGRVWDTKTLKCTQNCRVNTTKLIKPTATNAYCQGHINPNITKEQCTDTYHRLYINNTGCARRADQLNDNGTRYCPDPQYPNYIGESNVDKCVANTIVNTGKNTNTDVTATDSLSKETCRLLDRTWNTTKNACNRICASDGGTLLKDETHGVIYCQAAVWTTVTEQRCAELHRKWVGAGCARRADQKDTNNAIQCVAGYPYYNANFKPAIGNPTLIDVCEKTSKIAAQNEQQGILGGIQVSNSDPGTTPENPGTGDNNGNGDENGDESGVGDEPTGLPTGWTRNTSQVACTSNGRIWDNYLKACSWRAQGEQHSDACQKNTYTYVKRSKGSDTCISPKRVTKIVKHVQFSLHDAVCKIPLISKRSGCQKNTDGDDTQTKLEAATKVLVIVEENHSLAQMKDRMPYAFSKAKQYAYASNYSATVHPSLGNYIAIAAGDNLGIHDDALPSQHRLQGDTVFGKAINNGKTAKIYAEGMKGNCALDNQGSRYFTRHNPWTYFVDERGLCNKYDVPMAKNFDKDVARGDLPNVGMLIPNTCNDAHDTGKNCDLATADKWFKSQFEKITQGPDWKSGRLVVILTADEDENGEKANPGPNKVLTAVFHKSLSNKVVDKNLNHFSLSGFMSEVAGVSKLRKAANAPNMLNAFSPANAGQSGHSNSGNQGGGNSSPTTATFSFQNIGYVEKSAQAVTDKIKQGLGDRDNVIYSFAEIDEGDKGEHAALQHTFGDKGWSQFQNGNPTLGRMSSDWTTINSDKILLHKGGGSSNDFRAHGCPTPDRWLVVTEFAKKNDPNAKLATINTHFITHAYNQPSHPWCQQWWDQSWQKLQNKVAALHSNGFDIVITGDFNHSGNLPFLHAGTELVAHHGPDRILAIPGPNRKLNVGATGIVDTPTGEAFHKDLWARITFEKQ